MAAAGAPPFTTLTGSGDLDAFEIDWNQKVTSPRVVGCGGLRPWTKTKYLTHLSSNIPLTVQPRRLPQLEKPTMKLDFVSEEESVVDDTAILNEDGNAKSR